MQPPKTVEAFDKTLTRLQGGTHVAYFVCTEGGALGGVIDISEIVRGFFRSGYLGYYAFVPHSGQGYIKRGLRTVLSEAFHRHRLHRLEANINLTMRCLVI